MQFYFELNSTNLSRLSYNELKFYESKIYF